MDNIFYSQFGTPENNNAMKFVRSVTKTTGLCDDLPSLLVYVHERAIELKYVLKKRIGMCVCVCDRSVAVHRQRNNTYIYESNNKWCGYAVDDDDYFSVVFFFLIKVKKKLTPSVWKNINYV